MIRAEDALRYTKERRAIYLEECMKELAENLPKCIEKAIEDGNSYVYFWLSHEHSFRFKKELVGFIESYGYKVETNFNSRGFSICWENDK